MTRGFASFLFLFALSTLLGGVFTLTHPSFDESMVTFSLFLRRTELENGMDEIIREELHHGLILNLPSATLQMKINQRIIQLLENFPAQHEEPILYQTGFGKLEHTPYTSLIFQEQEPLTLTTLNQNSHVLILPLMGDARYGEYTYTGGLNATSILESHLSAQNEHTLFALPSGYRACVTTLTAHWECTPYE